MSDDPERYALALLELCLGDGWHAGVGIGPDGSVWPWLVAPDTDEPGHHVVPPHEQLGPLPALYAARVRRAAVRCSAPTLHGSPCRVTVATTGARCHLHRDAGASVEEAAS